VKAAEQVAADWVDAATKIPQRTTVPDDSGLIIT